MRFVACTTFFLTFQAHVRALIEMVCMEQMMKWSNSPRVSLQPERVLGCASEARMTGLMDFTQEYTEDGNNISQPGGI